MASFDCLPSELLIKIVDSAAEDYVALEDESSRRKILLNLALVSKAFTIPAQEALWRYIDARNLNELSFTRVISEGFGRDKEVKRLIFPLNSDGDSEREEESKWFLEVLRGIKGVEELRLYNEDRPVVYWLSPFEVASVKGKLTKQVTIIFALMQPFS